MIPRPIIGFLIYCVVGLMVGAFFSTEVTMSAMDFSNGWLYAWVFLWPFLLFWLIIKWVLIGGIIGVFVWMFWSVGHDKRWW